MPASRVGPPDPAPADVCYVPRRMRVNVLHHGHCFDGIASSALFCAFLRTLEPTARFELVPKHHALGDPFEPADFEADVVACLDFRYSDHPKLSWWFDHHRSAFQLPGQREHFEADASGRKFYDPQATSCTGLVARVAAERFGFDPSPHAELVRWAEIVDAAAFCDPAMPVLLEEPALRLMTFAEHNLDRGLLARFVDDLLTRPLAEVAGHDYVQRALAPVLAQHGRDIELLRARCRLRGGVVEYDLLDQPPRTYNKFIAYYHHPDARYVVGTSIGPDGKPRLTAGYNPWLPARAREHGLAELCERFGGGGHPFVGGVSFDAAQEHLARQAQAFIAAVLRGERAP
jgi:hypothetical protein